MSTPRRRVRGFTLLELMIAIAVVGILGAIALPTYLNYRLKTTRNIGTECLLAAHNRMEQFFARNGRYPDLAAQPLTQIGYPNESHACDPEGLYLLSIEIAANYSSYRLRAQAQGRQAADGNLVLTVTPARANPAERLLKQHETPSGATLAGWNFQPGQ